MSQGKSWLLLTLLFVTPLGQALTGDNEQPIHIESDQLDIDEQQRQSTYQGNVDMTQGSLHIEADRIVLHFDTGNTLEWLEINGQPATFKQLNDQQQEVSGQALTIYYYDRESLMKLMGKAVFQNHLDTIRSETITINTRTNALQAGDNSNGGRVRMLIQPKQTDPSQ